MLNLKTRIAARKFRSPVAAHFDAVIADFLAFLFQDRNDVNAGATAATPILERLGYEAFALLAINLAGVAVSLLVAIRGGHRRIGLFLAAMHAIQFSIITAMILAGVWRQMS